MVVVSWRVEGRGGVVVGRLPRAVGMVGPCPGGAPGRAPDAAPCAIRRLGGRGHRRGRGWTGGAGLVDHAGVPLDDAETKRPRWRAEPSPARLALDHPGRDEVLRRHRRACNAGEAVYVDPGTGYQVLTADALAGRGRVAALGVATARGSGRPADAPCLPVVSGLGGGAPDLSGGLVSDADGGLHAPGGGAG